MILYRRILSLVFALLVLVSSTSFMVGIHRCGDAIQNVALFDKAEGCAMEKLPPCHRKMTRNCCEDQTISYQSQDFSANVSPMDLQPPVGADVALPSVVLAEIIPADFVSTCYSQDYDPPIPPIDRTVTLQVFLI